MTTERDTIDAVTALTTGTPFVEFASNNETGSTLASPSSRGEDFNFQICVVVIGLFGTATNAVIVYALIASEEHKKHVLIFNQNVLDLVGCFFLFTRYAARLADIYLTGTPGYWLCVTIVSGLTSFSLQLSSLINLVAIAVERYLKVIHAVWSKKILRKWVIHSTMAFAWISGIVIGCAVGFPTTGVLNGACYMQRFWSSRTAQMAYGIWYFLSFYVLIVAICTFCYGRILVAIRRQARVMATHNTAGTGGAQIQTDGYSRVC